MPTSVFFDGRVIYTPGSYSRVDASGLESAGLSASGIVAVLGTAEGGKPVSAITEFADIPRFTSPEKMKAAYRSGQLKEVADMLFAPAKDPDILGGAQQVLALKTNPSTQSTASLKASGVPQVDLTSVDYGQFTSQVNVDVQAGSTKGKHLTIRFEDVMETVDDLGGDAMFSLQYRPGSYGYQTALAAVNAAGDISVTATRYSAGLVGDITANTANAVEIVGANQTGASATIAVASGIVTLSGVTSMLLAHEGRSITISGASNSGNNGTFTITQYVSATEVKYVNTSAVAEGAGFTWTVSDAGIKVSIYGLVGTTATKETLTHNGASTVTGTAVWGAAGVLGVVLDKAPVAGAITVKNAPGGSTLCTIPIGGLSKGAVICENCFVEKSAVSFALGASGAYDFVVFGRDQAGTVVGEKLTTNGTTAVPSVTTTWSQIDVLAINLVPTGKTITMTAAAAQTDADVQNKLSKVETYFGTKQRWVGDTAYGFTFSWGSGKTAFNPADLDIVSGVNVEYPATGSFTADLYSLVAWINQNSQLVSAVVSDGATSLPDNTPAPVFLAGGTDPVAAFANAQAALNLLKRGRVNSIVDLSGDPAIAAALDSHCAYMGGVGRSERDGFAGALNSGMDDVPTKAQFKQQVVDLNSRHMRLWGQAVTRYDAQGDRTEFLPPYGAAILAGMQAGSPVGTSLTHKYMNILGLRQHSSWNPTDDAEEMIQAGAVFGENVDGMGRRVVRNITTHLSSNNICFSEASVNQAVNFAVFNFRSAMESAVGKRGFSGTLAAARGVAVGTLGKLVDEDVITSYRSLTMELILDVMDVSVEIAPIVPINFVRTTVHLVNLAQTA